MTFQRIAIVNRGEPAMRLINAALEYNVENGTDLRTIALYTDPDHHSMFVREADEAYNIGHATFVDDDGNRQVSYVDHGRLERALIESGADAVWVGWGFVSEHAGFVDLCDRLGITFIGPDAAVMRRLGDKITSKQIAQASAVPVSEWSGGPVETVDEAREHADRIGYPVLIKATAGGGGRGIRRVDSSDQLESAFASARAEAHSAFGNGTVFVERLVAAAKHIEVQIIGDADGTVWPVGVRDCSVQRRNQKIIEEAPSPSLDAAQTREVCEAAVRLGRAAGYRNAGTVEFLFEPSSGQFSFMEVNARLQVEHPITEVTTGLDLVKLQLHVARGGRLLGEAPATVGHAIEARINAEDPERDFAASPGRIELLRLPTGPGLRVDTGVEEGDEIAAEFDSMIAKIIAHGHTRDEAMARLRRALDQTRIVVRNGTTNKAFVRNLLSRPEYIAGEVTIAWVDHMTIAEADHAEVAIVAAAINAARAERAVEIAAFRASALRGRPAIDPRLSQSIDLRHRGQSLHIEMRRLAPGDYRMEIDGHIIEAHREDLGRSRTILTIGDTRYRVVSTVHGITHFVEVDGQPHRIQHDEGGAIRSPAPGVVVSLEVAEGDLVAPGDRLAVVEAMKMETAIIADFAGTVRQIDVNRNDQVQAGARLLVIEPVDGAVEAVGTTRKLSFAELAVDGDVHHEHCSHWLRSIRQLLLGYDLDTAYVESLARPGADPCGNKLDQADQLRQEEEALSIFADVVSLFGREADDEDEALLRHGTEGYLFEYLRRVEARADGLPISFTKRLERTLGNFGVTSLDPSPDLDSALARIVRSHQRMSTQIGPVLQLLERRLEQASPSADDTRRALLEDVAQASRHDYPAVEDLVREIIYREFDAQFLASMRSRAIDEAEGHLAALEATIEASERAEHIQALVDCTQPMKTMLSRRFAIAEPAVQAALLEVMTRRYYRIRRLKNLSTEQVWGFSTVSAAYDLDGRSIQVVAIHVERSELARGATALAGFLTGLKTKREIVVDIYLWSNTAVTDENALNTEIRAVLEEALGHLQLHRIVVSTSDPSSNHGTGGVRHLTFRPAGDDRYRTEDLARGLHPMMAKRLELRRLDNFDLNHLPAPEDIYLFLGTARDNRYDERLFAIAEVRDLTAVRDENGTLLRLPEVERVVHEVGGAIRRVQAQREPHRRLESNRILLYVWPKLDLTADDLRGIVARLAPEVEGLGLQKVQLLAKVRLPSGKEATRTIELSDPAGGEGRIRVRRPTSRAIKTRGPHEQKVVRLRQRGLIDPYELLRMLAPKPKRARRGIPRGSFDEYDLVDDELVPVDREPGSNTANIVVGVVSNHTHRYPDGMRRVVLVGDPSRGMGNLAEAECRRIMAGFDLAEELDVPLEWFAVSAGARIAMDSGTENMDWIARVLRRIVEFTQGGGEINILVTGINVGAQPYWNAEATMLMHTRGVLIMTGGSSMVLTGKDALDYSGGVSAENNIGIGGYERIMGPNGQAQYRAHDIVDACRILLQHYEYTYVEPGERFPRRADTTDPVDRDIREQPHGGEFPTLAEVFSEETNPGRKKPFEIRQVMAATVDQDHPTLERWFGMREAEIPVVWDASLGGWPVCLLGFETKNLSRPGLIPADGPDRWTSSTLFPKGSKKVARAINATSGNRPLVVLASLSGFDGSPESMRTWQLEFGAEIGRAIVNFEGPIVFCVVSRYHGGAFVVFSGALNENMEVAALEGSHASVIGGAPAAAVVFARDVSKRTDNDPRLVALRDAMAVASGAERLRLTTELERLRVEVHAEKMGEVSTEFDAIHNVERALRVGSIDRIIPPAELRPYLIDAIERGVARDLELRV